MIQVVVIAIFVGIAAASHNGYNENDTGLRWCFGSWRSRRFGSHAFTDHGAASNGCIMDCWNIKAYRLPNTLLNVVGDPLGSMVAAKSLGELNRDVFYGKTKKQT